MESNIAEKLHVAKQKLAPVIRLIEETANCGVPFLTLHQYNNVIQASYLLREIENDLWKQSQNCYNFGSYDPEISEDDVKMLDHSKVYVDDRILKQLIELHDNLTEVINILRMKKFKKYKSLKTKQKENASPDKNMVLRIRPNSKLKRNYSEQELYFCETNQTVKSMHLSLSDLIVMPARGVLKPQLAKKASRKHPKNSKSEGRINDKPGTATDAIEAKDILIQCIKDLNRLMVFLDKKDEKAQDTTNVDRPESTDVLSLESTDGDQTGDVIISVPGSSNNKGAVKIIIKQGNKNQFHKTDQSDSSNLFDVITSSNIDNKVQRNVQSSKEKNCNVKLFEKHNICIHTDNNEELIISITVAPKNKNNQDIPSKKGRDHYLCLSRTKVCSSLQFDVEVAETRIKNEGISHDNPNVNSKLQTIGVDNLLRASRPVKCGRKALLNEVPKNCMPYTPSLKSLPLEEFDAEIINQSLDMTLKKSKHSCITIPKPQVTTSFIISLGHTDPNSRKEQKMVYFLNIIMAPPKKFINIFNLKQQLLKEKMDFYIHLNNGELKSSIYEVNFFDFHKFRTAKSKKSALSSTSTKPGCSFKKIELTDDTNRMVFKDKIEKKMLVCPFEGLGVEEQQIEKHGKTKEERKIRYKTTSKIPVYRYRLKDLRSSFTKVVKHFPSGVKSVGYFLSLFPDILSWFHAHSLIDILLSGNNVVEKKIEESIEQNPNIEVSKGKILKNNSTFMPPKRYKIETYHVIDIKGCPKQIILTGDKSLDQVVHDKNTKRIRKRKEFFTSRSHSEIVTAHESTRCHNYFDIGPDQINNTELLGQRKDATSDLIAYYISNYLSEKIIQKLSSSAKEEILTNIENLKHK